MQISLRTLLLLCVYAAVCSMNYVSSNLWVGTATIAATIVLLACTIIHAARTQATFPLIFSVVATSWILFWLGFYAENGPSSATWSLPRKVHRLMSGQGLGEPKPSTYTLKTYATMHSVHSSGLMGYASTESIPTPAYHNSIRLAICLSGISLGLLVGAAVHCLWLRRTTARDAAVRL